MKQTDMYQTRDNYHHYNHYNPIITRRMLDNFKQHHESYVRNELFSQNTPLKY